MIYFSCLFKKYTARAWTNSNSRKKEQIIANPHVSVVVEYVQIDGLASMEGHPTEVPEFLNVIRRKLPNRYESLVKSWSANKDRVVLKIVPSRVTLFKYDDPASGAVGGLHILNVGEGRAFRLQDSDITSKNKDAPAYRQ